jgi:AraC family transcriptional regulator
VFRDFYGKSPGEYLRQLRLDWAEAQMRITDAPLSQIALQAGFADQSHFTRTFKRHTGLTPGKYRQASRA